MYGIVERIVWILVLLGTSLFMGPFLDGLRRVLRAKIQRRIGPPILQTFYDLKKLFGLNPIGPFITKIYFIIPYVVFALILAMSTMTPIPYIPCLDTVFGAISFFYIILLIVFLYILAGLLLPNPYSNAGAAREALIISIFELFIASTIVCISYKLNTLNLYSIAILYGATQNYLKLSTLLLSISLLFLAYVESAYTPFDISEAETEILGGPMLEYSGRYYGLLFYSFLIKRYVLLSVPVGLIFVSPIINAIKPFIGGVLLSVISYLIYILFMSILLIIYASIETLYPRYRLDHALKTLTLAFLIPFIAYIIGWFGW